MTKELKGHAYNQIDSYIDSKQATARADLKKAMDTGNELPGFIFYATGTFGSEFLGGYIKKAGNSSTSTSSEKKEEWK